MAGSALGTAFSLLLLASIIQGLKDVQVLHNEEMEAVAGQDVVLPCTIKTKTTLQLVSIEWSKNRNENKKLALYSPGYGEQIFWPNVAIRIENESIGSHLHLSGVAKSDSDIYICSITTFPFGSIKTETKLKIKDVDVKTMCDADSTVEVHAGENVTIRCRGLPNAQYRWTKNEKLVSENESLELPWVTDAHAGEYTLTVSTGNKNLRKEFIIIVLTTSTRLRTDSATLPPQFNITEEGLIESADSSLTTSPTTGLPTIDNDITWSVGTSATDDNLNPTNVTIPAVNYTHSVTSSPATHTAPYDFNNTNKNEINTPYTSNTSDFSDQPVASNQTTTFGYGTVDGSTQEMRNVSVLPTLHPEINYSTSPEESSPPAVLGASDAGNSEDEDTDGARSHLAVLIIFPVLVLIVVAGFLYRKQTIKKRMDLPPPFKPPPPPVKYAPVINREISTQRFPISRCNSVNVI